MRGVLMAVLLAAGSVARAQGVDVGLVNLVSGDVTYASSVGAPAKVQAFMKVRDGDRFNVSAGAQLRVVFFESARQERWAGPAGFVATKTGSTPITGKAMEVVTLPAGVPQRIARVPELIQYARLGGIQVRGGLTRQQKASIEQQEAIRSARDTHALMQKELQPNDITPDLYLYAALYEFLMYDEMRSVVADMRRKQPGNEDIKALEIWVAARASR
jgi:hypothetical protein